MVVLLNSKLYNVGQYSIISLLMLAHGKLQIFCFLFDLCTELVLSEQSFFISYSTIFPIPLTIQGRALGSFNTFIAKLLDVLCDLANSLPYNFLCGVRQ